MALARAYDHESGGVSLPRRLSSTTLGDLLGRMHRARLSGVLELREVRGVTAGRLHLVHLREGLIVFASSPRGAQPEAASGETPPMTRDEIQRALEPLYRLEDAELAFRVAQRRREVATLSPTEFLHGRPRARDREATGAPELPLEKRRALATLGLAPGATATEVQEAFKRLASRVHPDRHPTAEPHEREALSAHFARRAQAYHALVA